MYALNPSGGNRGQERGEPSVGVRVLPAAAVGRGEGTGGGESAGESGVFGDRDQAASR